MLNISLLNPRAELWLRSAKAKLMSNTINRDTLSMLLMDRYMINAKIYINYYSTKNTIEVGIAKYLKFSILFINLHSN